MENQFISTLSEFPHEKYIEDHHLEKLPIGIRRLIKQFEDKYRDFSKDHITNMELEELLNDSNEIKKQLQQTFKKEEGEKNSLGFLGWLILGVGLSFLGFKALNTKR